MISAPATMAASLARARSRGRNFMPQSGDTESCSGDTDVKRLTNAVGDLFWCFHLFRSQGR